MQWMWSGGFSGATKELVEALRQHKPTRGLRRTTAAKRTWVPEELRIVHRPEEVAQRLIPGHWEGDLIKGAFNRSCVGTLVERKTRFVVLCKMDGCTAQDALEGFTRQMRKLPHFLPGSLTYDRETEMTCYPELMKRLNIDLWLRTRATPHLSLTALSFHRHLRSEHRHLRNLAGSGLLFGLLQIDARLALAIELRLRIHRLAPHAHDRLLRRAGGAWHTDHIVEDPARSDTGRGLCEIHEACTWLAGGAAADHRQGVRLCSISCKHTFQACAGFRDLTQGVYGADRLSSTWRALLEFRRGICCKRLAGQQQRCEHRGIFLRSMVRHGDSWSTGSRGPQAVMPQLNDAPKPQRW
ncbi:transposase [Xanthomonas oryzae pv. oryzicola BLS256]|uniref:Transposase n=1 Tax=Xanthomonas oryzae pv. oryzicola (strain BLS256) TaxID=383407 RepID=G7TFP5_XANOB|nr:transposase [Xanthomonas oryzae pv. oryzicola BLS256]